MTWKDKVLDWIPTGSDKAILLKDLAAYTGISERAVKRIINDLRREDYVIISKASGGYFFPDVTSEKDVSMVKSFARMMDSQAEERQESKLPAVKWLATIGITL
jgi:biotin operon repressor